MELIKQIFSLIFLNISNYRDIFCSHNWEYWHIKLKCDHHKNINDTILYNNVRKCSKCEKSQQLSLVPKNIRWRETSVKLSKDIKTVEIWVNVLGKKNKHQDREEKLQELINKMKRES